MGVTGMAEYIEKEIAVKGLRMAHDLDGADFVANIPAADVRENVPVALRIETEEIEGHPTWYRRRFYCPECGLLIRTESWDEERCFGAGTCLRQNIDPKYCPNCGAQMGGAGDGK